MISILLIVFLIQLAIHLVTTLGSDAINNILWQTYCKLPTPHSKKGAAIASLRQEVVALNREMNNTSAQDDFARWAKLRRQHDKKKDEYEKTSREIQDFQATFNRAVGILRWVATSGIRYALQWWFSKRAMFWLPQGWVPHAVEWILSLTAAPLGSISINMWWIACASMISLVSEIVLSGIKLSQRQGQAVTEKQPLPSGTKVSEKKEL
ncbi:hypothetical protein AMS68_002891 [Peltaster fructicola]|uniref:Uncharacterized protein n=1 Tax=Peltaster fructicola TaxID=286661 RepID=A0A6H0XRL7_9PEZI|nr:hypothetical protein AMS68_002891 [Peltaster fructicola]